MAIFLASLQPYLASQIRGQILGVDSVPTLQSTFSWVLCVSTGTTASSAASDRREDVALELLVDEDVVVTVASVSIVVVAITLLIDAGTSLDGLLGHILHHQSHLP